MINLNLKKEIILHIFNLFGCFGSKYNTIQNLIDNQFLIDKKVAFENEGGEKQFSNIYAAYYKIDNSIINIMITDFNDEYVMIAKLDSYPMHALRISNDIDDNGTFCVNIENNRWVDCGTLLQAKLLAGFESISEIFSQWNKSDDYSEMYKTLIGFLNQQELKH